MHAKHQRQRSGDVMAGPHVHTALVFVLWLLASTCLLHTAEAQGLETPNKTNLGASSAYQRLAMYSHGEQQQRASDFKAWYKAQAQAAAGGRKSLRGGCRGSLCFGG